VHSIALTAALPDVLETLRAHESDLRRLGVSHAAVFGAVARGEAGAESDIDVLGELDEDRPMGFSSTCRTRQNRGRENSPSSRPAAGTITLLSLE
jgi:uncharacterized protein